MNFEKAYKQLLDGKKIRRREWNDYMHLRMVGSEVKTYTGELTSYYTDSNILISTGWIVMDGDGTELTFFDCIEHFKSKKKITKKEWIDEGLDQYIYIDNNQFVKCRPVEYTFMPTFQCLCANDWEIQP